MGTVISIVLVMIGVCVGIILAIGLPLRRRASEELRPVVTTLLATLSVLSVAFAFFVGYALGTAHLDEEDLFSPTIEAKQAEYSAHCDGPLADGTPANDAWEYLEQLGVPLRDGPPLGSGETTNGWIGDRIRHSTYWGPVTTNVRIVDENVRNRAIEGDRDMVMVVQVGREFVVRCSVGLNRHGR